MFKSINTPVLENVERNLGKHGYQVIDIYTDDIRFKQHEKAEHNRRLQELAEQDPSVALWLMENKELVESF